jgi:DNA-binding SARP family transcriptional activator
LYRLCIFEAIVETAHWVYVVETLERFRTRIQLCGHLVVELEGRRLEDRLFGRQGRLLFSYLAANRGRPVDRESLAEVLWPGEPPGTHAAALRPLISRLRRVLGEQRLEGRSELRLMLPADAWIDVEKAAEAIHDAQAAIALGRWKDAWLPARIAWSVTSRTFMAGFDDDWIDERRRGLEELRLCALECIAEVGLRLGGAELPAAERSARSLIELSPYHESGYRLLMETLEARSNVAEALQVYENLRCRLRDELGAAPGAEVQAVHTRLLRNT